MKKKIFTFMLICTVFFAGCNKSDNQIYGSVSTENSNSVSTKNIITTDMFTNRDLKVEYDENSSAVIQLNGNSALCDSDTVKISESTITINDEGTYIISGTLNDGMIIVDAKDTDKIQIVLNNVEISNSKSAAIYVLNADKVVLTTAAASDNMLSNGGSYVAIDDNNIDAVVFSKEDLTLNGSGKLTIQTQAGHGVVSKDDLVLTSGEYSISAADHGLCGKDSVRIADGSYEIVSGKDGIHSENAEDDSLGFVYIANGTFNINADGDGISSESYQQIDNGNFNIQSGGGSDNAVAKTPKPFERQGRAMQGQGMPPFERPANSMQGEHFQPFKLDENSTQKEVPQPKSDENLTQKEMPQPFQKPAEETQQTLAEDTISTKGIKAGGDLYLCGGTFKIDSADDSIHSNGNIIISSGDYQIDTGDDGIHSDSAVTISDGNIKITKSYEGIEGKTIDITGGNISLVASDDGLNVNGGADNSGIGVNKDQFANSPDTYISISGGNIFIDASGDGIDSNGSLTVSGGETYVSGPTSNGDGFLDYNGEAVITGGLFVAAGSSGMADNFGTSSTQGSMLVPVNNGTAGDEITLTDSNGNVLISWQAEKNYSCVLISCPELAQGNNYTLVTGDTSKQISMSSLIYGESSMKGGKNMGGGRRQR